MGSWWLRGEWWGGELEELERGVGSEKGWRRGWGVGELGSWGKLERGQARGVKRGVKEGVRERSAWGFAGGACVWWCRGGGAASVQD